MVPTGYDMGATTLTRTARPLCVGQLSGHGLRGVQDESLCALGLSSFDTEVLGGLVNSVDQLASSVSQTCGLFAERGQTAA